MPCRCRSPPTYPGSHTSTSISWIAPTMEVLRILPFSSKPNQTHYSPSTNINQKATSYDILLVIQAPKRLRLAQIGKVGVYIDWMEGRWFLLSWEGPYLLVLFHLNRGKETKLTSSAPSGPTIYQTSITKILDMESLTPYLATFQKRIGMIGKGLSNSIQHEVSFNIYKSTRGENWSIAKVL